MKQDSYETIYNRLLIIRWITLLAGVVDSFFGVHSIPILPVIILTIYCALQTVCWHTSRIECIPLVYRHSLDVSVCGGVLIISGGGWASPFIVYALTGLLFVAFSLSMRRSIIFGAYFCVLLTAGVLLNRDTTPAINSHNLDMLLLSYFLVFTISIFVSYLFSHIAKSDDNSTFENEIPVIDEIEVQMQPQSTPGSSGIYTLSSRELDILRALSTGKTNKQIAEQLFIAEKTVKNHLYHIFKKLDVSSRDEAIISFRNTDSSKSKKD